MTAIRGACAASYDSRRASSASISEGDAEHYADAALENGKVRGYESGYESGYRYLVSTTEDETVVLILNSEREIQTMRSLLWISLAIAAA